MKKKPRAGTELLEHCLFVLLLFSNPLVIVAGQILEGTAMLLEAGLTGIDLATGLAGQIVVHVLQVHPQRHFRVAAATALAADGGVLAFFDGFLAKGKPVQHFLRQ